MWEDPTANGSAVIRQELGTVLYSCATTKARRSPSRDRRSSGVAMLLSTGFMGGSDTFVPSKSGASVLSLCTKSADGAPIMQYVHEMP